ncbi:hypothetical protein E4U14_000319 [Claviceps sp. LM454 group G7]|nr:hypothetical protein E4U14_000319 [Claviceps sp. LM454 group G7]
MHALSLLALFLHLVKANLHNQCYCMTWRPHTDWIHNTMLTEYICTQQYPGAAQFDTVTGRCVVKAGWVFDGQTWEGQCKDGAFQGYFPIKNGKPDLSINPITDTLAVGSCPDRN